MPPLTCTLGSSLYERHYYDQVQFRVWADGTVQAVEDGEPYSWMSDDFMVVWAYSDEEALRSALYREAA